MGPLHGLKVVEMAGIGPGPFAAMLLADLGATVIRVDRKEPAGLGIKRPLKYDLTLRGRKAIALDLKDPRGVETTLRLIEQADALLEGFRPGVMEKLGLGPDVCLARNPRLVYGRMTGWGQSGPLAKTAGHDLGYIAVTGVLNAMGRPGEPPAVPLNLVGDYGGGALYLVIGMLAALLDAKGSGRGQVIDAAIVDGTASLATSLFGMLAGGVYRAERGTNIADSGAHFYDSYQCSDGKWLSISPIEGKFYVEMLQKLGLTEAEVGPQMDPTNWPRAKAVVAAKVRTRTRDEWTAIFSTGDACVAPVLAWDEAPKHPHLAARGTFVEIDGVMHPAPAPRFSRTAPGVPSAPAPITPENTEAALAAWLPAADVAALRASGVLG